MGYRKGGERMGKEKLHKAKSEESNKKNAKKKMPLKDNVIRLEKASKKKADNKNKKMNKKLSEHTAFKNKDKKHKKKRKAVWVKEFTLYYEEELHKLQIELLKMQKQVRNEGLRLLMLFEGRDAAGKGGTIKRITEHLNPRGTRVVALLTPSDTERSQWYFQRYMQHLPSAGEVVLFDRSWYNRAMVEPVMDFCTDEQNKRFLKDVPMLEEMLVKDGIKLFKFFFSVSKDEQLRRFDSRETDPLKQYKISPVDKLAQEMWDGYTVRKFQMLNETNRTLAPWTIIRSDNKKLARLNCIKHLLSQIDYKDKVPVEELQTDPEILISGIDEIRFMEDNLLSEIELPG
jgi:polyphosphate kinase 2